MEETQIQKKKVKTNIPGKWNKIETLDASYRSNENLVIIADKFQKEFLRNKYEYEKIKSKKISDYRLKRELQIIIIQMTNMNTKMI